MFVAAPLLLACGSRPPPLATEPDAKATEAVVHTLCDLVKGAGHRCTERTRQAVIDDDDVITAEVMVDQLEETLGQVTISGRVRVRARDQWLVTRFDHTGWGAEEAFSRGVHLWAVLAGAPIVDWVLSDPSRPALSALYRQTPDWSPRAASDAGAFRAVDGWTFGQGVKKELDHAALVAAFAGNLTGLATDAPHTVEIRVASELGEQVFTCHVDGTLAPELCAAARRGPWPSGAGWEMRQTYVLVPQNSFPAGVPAPPEAPAPP